MTQNLECLTSLDSSWKQKNRKKMKLFLLGGWGGEEGMFESCQNEQAHRVIGTDGKYNPPTTLKNRKCSMKFPKK
jgi:hypothetical protein